MKLKIKHFISLSLSSEEQASSSIKSILDESGLINEIQNTDTASLLIIQLIKTKFKNKRTCYKIIRNLKKENIALLNQSVAKIVINYKARIRTSTILWMNDDIQSRLYYLNTQKNSAKINQKEYLSRKAMIELGNKRLTSWASKYSRKAIKKMNRISKEIMAIGFDDKSWDAIFKHSLNLSHLKPFNKNIPKSCADILARKYKDNYGVELLELKNLRNEHLLKTTKNILEATNLNSKHRDLFLKANIPSWILRFAELLTLQTFTTSSIAKTHKNYNNKIDKIDINFKSKSKKVELVLRSFIDEVLSSIDPVIDSYDFRNQWTKVSPLIKTEKTMMSIVKFLSRPTEFMIIGFPYVLMRSLGGGVDFKIDKKNANAICELFKKISLEKHKHPSACNPLEFFDLESPDLFYELYTKIKTETTEDSLNLNALLANSNTPRDIALEILNNTINNKNKNSSEFCENEVAFNINFTKLDILELIQKLFKINNEYPAKGYELLCHNLLLRPELEPVDLFKLEYAFRDSIYAVNTIKSNQNYKIDARDVLKHLE